jgi:GT2 family glycosyltransferase
VIVTDDGGDAVGGLRERYPTVHFVRGPGRGPAANRNNGARHARGEWLVFTDDDCIPDSTWLAAFAEAFRDAAEVGVFEGRVYVDSPRQSLADYAPLNESGGYLWSCNIAVQKSIYSELEGFDERFPIAAMEDVDFAFRIRESGRRPQFVPNAAVFHPWRSRIPAHDGWRKLIQIRKSTFLYLAKHPDEARRMTSLYFLEMTARRLVRGTLPGLIRYRGRGIREMALIHANDICTAGELLLRPLKPKTSS